MIPAAAVGAVMAPAASVWPEMTGILQAVAYGPMSAFEFAAVLRRRWYVLALAGLFTLVGMWAVHVRPISYQGCEGLYFSGTPWVENVYLDGNPSLAVVAGMVTETMMSQPMQQRIRARSNADYAVAQTNTGEIRLSILWPAHRTGLR